MQLSKSRVFVAAVALALMATSAISANNTFFTAIGDLVFPFAPPRADGTNGTIGDATGGGMAPLNGNASYSKTIATSLFNLTFTTHQREILLQPAGTLDYGYVTFAATPIDGALACMFSTAAITTFYLAANTGQTLHSAITTMAANTRYCYTYSKSNTTWDRSQ